MTIDLDALHIVSVTIYALLRVTPEQETTLSEKIRTYRKGWPRHPLVKLGINEHEGIMHHMDFSITHMPRPSRQIRLQLQVHQMTTERISRRSREKQVAVFNEISDVIGYIEGMNLEARCHAHINWNYEPKTHETIIRLPMLASGGDTLPFEFISGVRFIKPSEHGDISIIVDTNRAGRLVVTAQIPLSDGIFLKKIDEVVQMSTDIIKDFIFEIPAEHE